MPSAENDAWGERPEDVLLCLDPRCRMAYGHDGECDIPSVECVCGAPMDSLECRQRGHLAGRNRASYRPDRGGVA